MIHHAGKSPTHWTMTSQHYVHCYSHIHRNDITAQGISNKAPSMSILAAPCKFTLEEESPYFPCVYLYLSPDTHITTNTLSPEHSPDHWPSPSPTCPDPSLLPSLVPALPSLWSREETSQHSKQHTSPSLCSKQHTSPSLCSILCSAAYACVHLLYSQYGGLTAAFQESWYTYSVV